MRRSGAHCQTRGAPPCSSLFHPHIVTVNDAMATRNFFCLVTEPVHGGTLASYVHGKGSLPEKAARFLFQQLVMVIAFCHSRGVYVTHLTPDRIVIDWAPGKLPVLKLADCGFATGRQVWAPCACAASPRKRVRNEPASLIRRSAYKPAHVSMRLCCTHATCIC
jgi:serine/threonine protein kinase